MVIEPLVKNLLEAGVHFGHQTHRWNPKMKRFIFGEKNGIYLVDLEKTAQGLQAAQDFLRKASAEGGPILFVGTKRQAQSIIAQEAVRCGHFFVNLRWLGGLLTNFQTIRKSIGRLKAIRQMREDGTFEKLTKKEVAQLEKELGKLERVLGGIIEMSKLPKALFVVDAKREETAVREAIRLGIPVVALVDTNSDPDPIAYPIPGNDDAIRSVKLVTSLLADSVLEGHQAYLTGLAEKEKEEAGKRKKQEEEEAARMAAAQEKQRQEKESQAEKVAVQEKTSSQEASAPESSPAETAAPENGVKTELEVKEPPKKAKPKAKESSGEGKSSAG